MDPDLHSRVELAEARQGREERVNGAFVDAKGKFAAGEALEVGETLAGFIAEIQEALGVILEESSRIGQANGTSPTDEDGLADRFLELADGLADGGLCPIELLSGAGEAAVPRHGKKDFEFGEVHGIPSGLYKSRLSRLEQI
jgi:hypothetical protein